MPRGFFSYAACALLLQSVSSQTWKESARRRGHHGREARVAPGFDALVAEADFVRRAPPRRGTRSILRAARCFLRSAWPAFASSWGRRGGDAHIRERIHQTGINRKALAFNDPRFRWNRHVFPDGGSDAPGEDHGGVFDGRPGNRHDLRSAYGKILRFASLSKESWRAIAKQ